MDKKNWTWNTQRLPEQARVVRWGHFGTPVLLFPTAGGDYEEVERFHMVRVLGEEFIDKAIIPQTQLRRLILPEEIGHAICFMIRNAAVSGQLWADAGWHPTA